MADFISIDEIISRANRKNNQYVGDSQPGTQRAGFRVVDVDSLYIHMEDINDIEPSSIVQMELEHKDYVNKLVYNFFETIDERIKERGLDNIVRLSLREVNKPISGSIDKIRTYMGYYYDYNPNKEASNVFKEIVQSTQTDYARSGVSVQYEANEDYNAQPDNKFSTYVEKDEHGKDVEKVAGVDPGFNAKRAYSGRMFENLKQEEQDRINRNAARKGIQGVPIKRYGVKMVYNPEHDLNRKLEKEMNEKTGSAQLRQLLENDKKNVRMKQLQELRLKPNPDFTEGSAYNGNTKTIGNQYLTPEAEEALKNELGYSDKINSDNIINDIRKKNDELKAEIAKLEEEKHKLADPEQIKVNAKIATREYFNTNGKKYGRFVSNREYYIDDKGNEQVRQVPVTKEDRANPKFAGMNDVQIGVKKASIAAGKELNTYLNEHKADIDRLMASNKSLSLDEAKKQVGNEKRKELINKYISGFYKDLNDNLKAYIEKYTKEIQKNANIYVDLYKSGRLSNNTKLDILEKFGSEEDIKREGKEAEVEAWLKEKYHDEKQKEYFSVVNPDIEYQKIYSQKFEEAKKNALEQAKELAAKIEELSKNVVAENILNAEIDPNNLTTEAKAKLRIINNAKTNIDNEIEEELYNRASKQSEEDYENFLKNESKSFNRGEIKEQANKKAGWGKF